MKETKVREFGKGFIKAILVFGKSFWMVLKKLGLLLNECYSWIAYVRTKAPRTSLTIELIFFLSISISFMMSCYIDKVHHRDEVSKKLYDMEIQYNDSIIKAEVEGYNRGIRDKQIKKYEEKQTNEEQ